MSQFDPDSIENSVSISLSNSDQCALVSREDYPLLSLFKWRMNHGGYALNGHSQFMHHIVCPVGHGLVVDHINGNTLDNRRSNLRAVSRAQNNLNRRKSEGCISEFKGVTWFKSARHRIGYWKASICGKLISYHESEIDAALAYDSKARELYGQFARLNFSLGVVSPLDRMSDRRSPPP